MTSMDLLESFTAVKGKYVLEAHGEEVPEDNIINFEYNNKTDEGTHIRHRIPVKKCILVSAIVAAMLVLAGFCYWVMKLRELSVGEYTYTKPNPQNSAEQMAVADEFISMQGLKDSKEHNATKEWQDFLAGYDIEAALAESGNEPTGYEHLSLFYQVYNEEMYDKLAEIAEKYDLKLHSVLNVVSQEELDFRVGGSFMGDGLSRDWAYIYENGSFQFDGSAIINQEEVIIQLRRSVKGTLDEPILNIGSADEYQEVQYKTACGETVLLELGKDHSLIYADFEDCFILMNILAGREPWILADTTITIDDLKQVADEIDYTILKNVAKPDMRGDSLVETGQAAEDERILAYQEILKDIYYNQRFPGGRDQGYDGYDISDNMFAIQDIDSDGSEELIILYFTTYMAGHAVIIYDYDEVTGSVREQFIEYPAVTYFDNGILMADWSHNQGLGGRFWPYTLYQYNPGEDTYEAVAMVDAWDKSLSDKDYEGNAFPDEIDKDGDLLVFYIMYADEYELKNPVDWDEYKKWLDSYTEDAEYVRVQYMELTEENIYGLE